LLSPGVHMDQDNERESIGLVPDASAPPCPICRTAMDVEKESERFVIYICRRCTTRHADLKWTDTSTR
jgi:hypothetical protein